MAVRKLGKEEWTAFFNRVSKGLVGKRAEIEIDSLALGCQVEAEWMPLLGIVYDPRNDVIEIALDGHDHLIHKPKEVYVDEGPVGLTSIEVIDAEGAQQIVQLRDPLMLPAPSVATSESLLGVMTKGEEKRLSVDASGSAQNPDWKAVLLGDRAAFQAAVTPQLQELLDAARREVRYRVALGDFGANDLTAEEIVGEVLLRAWEDRHRRPRGLGMKAWLLALLFRVVRHLAKREARLRRMATVSLEAPVPPEPVYDDDEGFWEWYQPDELTRWEDVVATPSMTPEEVAAMDEELFRELDPRMREAFLMFELHRVPLREVALALGLPVSEAARPLEDARRRLGIGMEGKSF